MQILIFKPLTCEKSLRTNILKKRAFIWNWTILSGFTSLICLYCCFNVYPREYNIYPCFIRLICECLCLFSWVVSTLEHVNSIHFPSNCHTVVVTCKGKGKYHNGSFALCCTVKIHLDTPTYSHFTFYLLCFYLCH